MEKEIVIINDINVADCSFLDYGSRSLCRAFKYDISGFHQGNCIQNPNCYYKQIQRLRDANKCQHLVLGECSKTGKNCIGLKQCVLKLEKEYSEQQKITDFWKKIAKKLFYTKKENHKNISNLELEIKILKLQNAELKQKNEIFTTKAMVDFVEQARTPNELAKLKKLVADIEEITERISKITFEEDTEYWMDKILQMIREVEN